MRVLAACECSGAVRRAFREKGHDAWSCDIQESEDNSEFHIMGDALAVLDKGWDLMIAHPPCTYLSRAGARWWKDESRKAKADEAEKFVMAFWNAPIPMIAIENPIGQLNKRWRYPDQIIHPWYFGDPYSKATCLWLKNLPPLMATVLCGHYQPFLPSNTGWNRRKGQNWSPGVARNAKDASRTFPGIAAAMADQWGITDCGAKHA